MKSLRRSIRFVWPGLLLALLLLLHHVCNLQLALFGIHLSLLYIVILVTWLAGLVLRSMIKGENTYLVFVAKLFLFFCILILGLFLFFASAFYAPHYVEATEPQTGRTFAVECYGTFMKLGGTATLYERHGPFLVRCNVPSYTGEYLHETPSAYISSDGHSIVVSCFFLDPVFSVPL